MARRAIEAGSRRRAVILLAACGGLWACCASPPAEVPAAAAEVATVAERSSEPLVDCGALSELACIDSPDCTLRVEAEGGYACAGAADGCERGFVQRAGRAEDCPEGCEFVPARCYCAPDVTCICSGGPPALCREFP